MPLKLWEYELNPALSLVSDVCTSNGIASAASPTTGPSRSAASFRITASHTNPSAHCASLAHNGLCSTSTFGFASVLPGFHAASLSKSAGNTTATPGRRSASRAAISSRFTTSASTRGPATKSSATARVNGPSPSTATNSGSFTPPGLSAGRAKISPKVDASTIGTTNPSTAARLSARNSHPVFGRQREDEGESAAHG